MTNEEKTEARIANTEKALFSIITILQDVQPPYVQDGLNNIMNAYFDANKSLGFEPQPNFIFNS